MGNFQRKVSCRNAPASDSFGLSPPVATSYPTFDLTLLLRETGDSAPETEINPRSLAPHDAHRRVRPRLWTHRESTPPLRRHRSTQTHTALRNIGLALDTVAEALSNPHYINSFIERHRAHVADERARQDADAAQGSALIDSLELDYTVRRRSMPAQHWLDCNTKSVTSNSSRLSRPWRPCEWP
jgi:hypothetical protein